MNAPITLASRPHHTAYVGKDLEATGHFYLDLLSLPTRTPNSRAGWPGTVTLTIHSRIAKQPPMFTRRNTR